MMQPSISYYDNIARDYNSHMTKPDDDVRKYTGKIFNENISGGNILDFGGGTGLDLTWLLCDKYKVYFLEPSLKMRSLAEKSVSENTRTPFFIQENTDFHDWSENNLPLHEKMNGVLANFAVLNCIPDIDRLFEKLSLICSDHCYIQATVLDTSPIKMIKTHSLKVAIKALLNRRLTTLNNYNGLTQKTYLHTRQQYQSAARKYFKIISFDSIDFSHFALLVLLKK
jgi:ubiquinone/menaquinone biosynthesis C-methylase UbiE